MQRTLWKLNNVIKNYEWGSKTALSQLFNFPNPEYLPQAEIWMGAHLAGMSMALNQDGSEIALDQLINQHPDKMLGESTYKTYPSLPYLFKVLSATSPLSIQVHPELSKAKIGYEKENHLGIKLDSPQRNYKDPNHKPELVYAITPFLAMNGFRPINQIIALFDTLSLSSVENHVNEFKHDRSDRGLEQLFYAVLTLESTLKQQAISELKSKIDLLDDRLANLIDEIAEKFPNDNGLFAPLILNVIELQRGQAMFLRAQTPHAYLKGTALEIMASSDNVLRAGLTSKHIDINELFDNTTFHSIDKQQLLTLPIYHHNKTLFPVPVNDFAFEIISSDNQAKIEEISSAVILFCLKGEITLSTQTDTMTIHCGESVFIACCAQRFRYQGQGVFAKAYNH